MPCLCQQSVKHGCDDKGNDDCQAEPGRPQRFETCMPHARQLRQPKRLTRARPANGSG